MIFTLFMSAKCIFIRSDRPEDFSFDGYVEIYLTCNKVTDKLYLHMNQLEMDNSTIMFRAVDDNDTPPGEYQNIQCFNTMYTMRHHQVNTTTFNILILCIQ